MGHRGYVYQIESQVRTSICPSVCLFPIFSVFYRPTMTKIGMVLANLSLLPPDLEVPLKYGICSSMIISLAK